jgi:exonuclease III
VRGLTHPAKAKALAGWATEFDVALVQEVWGKAGVGEGTTTLPGYPGNAYAVPGEHNNQGAMILARQASKGLVGPLPAASAAVLGGRAVRVDLSVAGRTLAFISIYAPAQPGERRAFFASDDLRRLFPTDASTLVVLGGDFNCITDDHDQVGGRGPGGQEGEASASRREGREQLLTLISSLRLVDAWRESWGPSHRDFTRWDGTGSGARLDRFYVSAELAIQWRAASWIGGTMPLHSDHLPVVLVLTPPGQTPMGPGWRSRWDLTLADDDTYKAWLEAAEATLRAQPLPAGPNPHMQRLQSFKELASELAAKRSRENRAEDTAAMRAAEKREARAKAGLRRAVSGEQGAPARGAAWAEYAAAVAASRQLGEQRMAARNSAMATLDQLFGDAPSYFFFQQQRMRAPAPPTVIDSLRPAPNAPAIDLTQPGAATSRAVADLVEAYFSGDSPTGVFRSREGPDTQAARQRLLTHMRSLHSWSAGASEGWEGDGSAVEGEMRAALRQAARSSGAGADGLPYEFWAAYWHLGAPYLVAAFNEALASDRPDALAPLLLGVIILIHKPGKARDLLLGYRPITLLNTDVRIWAKVLANRLQIPLDELIDPEQTAFIGGREIGDRIHHLRALIAYMQQRHEPLWLLLSDLASAYDSVNWGWLEACMGAMGFRGGGHVRWALLLHRGARSAVVLNGWRLQPFPLRGGLMQGSGVSPLYWTIVMQPLVAYVNSLGTLHRVRLPSLETGMPAAHGSEGAAPMGAYADDGATALVVGPQAAQRGQPGPQLDPQGQPEASPAVAQAAGQVQAVLDASRTYEAASGVPPSIPKTELVGAVDAGGGFAALYATRRAAQEEAAAGEGRGRPREGDSVFHASGVLLAPPGSAPRVLGVPLTADEQAARQKAFAGAAGAITAAATGWLPMQLSLAQRVLVAKACHASKSVYQMQFYRLPQRAGQQAQAAIRAYVAAPAGPTEAGPHAGRMWPREAIAALPPRQGGLGYPMLRHANNGLLAKAAAQAFTPGTQVWKVLFLGMFARAAREAGEEAGWGGAGRCTAVWPVVAAAAVACAAARGWVARCAAALPPALQAHAQAIISLGTKRVVKPSEMGFYSVMAEPVCWNPDILVGGEANQEGGERRGGRCLQPGDLGEGGGALRTLGDVRMALLLGPAAPGGLAAAAARVRAAVPPAWLPHLDTAGEPPPEWWCTAGKHGVMGDLAAFAVASPTPPSPGWSPQQWAAALYRQLPTGRLTLACPTWALSRGAAYGAVDPAAQSDAAAYIQAAAAALCPPAARWLPAAVFKRDKPQHRWTRADHEAVAEARGDDGGEAQLDAARARDVEQAVPPEHWLAGPWADLPLDPTVWGTAAGEPLLRYTVRRATACFTSGAAGLKPGAAIRPGIWPSPEGRGPRAQAGLADLEARWAADFAARSEDPVEAERQARGRAGVAASPSQEEWDAAGDDFLRRDAPWLWLSQAEPEGTSARAARAAARAARREGAEVAAAAAAAAAGGDDDGAQAGGAGAAPEAAGPELSSHDADAGRAWRRLHGDTTMRREDRVVAYRIMHGALGVNALRLHVLTHLPRGEGLCPCADCRTAGRLETLSHVFLDCPTAGPVLNWMLDFWAALTPGAPQPPRDDTLLLLGDKRESEGGSWRPQPGHEAMWGRLRVAWLGAVWEARCSQLGLPGVPPMPAQARARATAAALLARLTGAAKLHWRRVESDVRRLSTAFPSTWFRGRDPALALDTFLEEWGMGGRFCEAVIDPAPRISIRVTADAPVPLPPPGDDGDGGAPP